MKAIIFLFTSVLCLFSCSFSQRIKDGEMAYGRKQYHVAVPLLTEEFNSSSNSNIKARKAFLLGKSHINLLEYDEALDWYIDAVKYKYGSEAFFELANTYKILEDYDNAIIAFQEFIQLTGRKTEGEREIFICREAKSMKNSTTPYSVARIFENSSTLDYSPVLYESDFLIFTSDRPLSTGNEIYNWTGERFSDLFIMLKNGSEVKRFDSAINSKHNEGAACFTKDFNKIYFTRCFSETGDDYCKIMVADRINGVWSEAMVLPFIKEKINYGHPALIENDSVLVFSTDLNEPGATYDLYYVEVLEDEQYSDPEPLPQSINTQGNEKFPTAHADTLYFSSDYLPGMGGLDIFKTYLEKDGRWAKPVNLMAPINSGGDDFGLVVDDFARLTGNMVQKGYFSSSRSGSGKDDIYIFTRRVMEVSPPEVIVEEGKDKSKRTVYLAGKTLQNTYNISDDPNSGISGTELLNNTYVKVTDQSGKTIAELSTTDKALYVSEVAENNTYTVIASKPGYLNQIAVVSTFDIPWKENETMHTVNADLLLNKIYAEIEITLRNIYYDYDKWDIKEEAKPALYELELLLKNNPQIRIQLSSHTDCRGEREYNQVLSQRRAQSVVDYLIDKGIKEDRLLAIGYGKDNLLINCDCEKCTEDEHQQNRRTTFKILMK